MIRYILPFLLALSMLPAGLAAPPDEFKDWLTHAYALYYQATFKESIDLLLRIDNLLRPQRGRVPEKVNVKMQLALGYAGLNDTAQAKQRFRELYELDANYSLDTQQFSPKILKLA